MNKSVLKSLTSLRFIAIAAIFAHHLDFLKNYTDLRPIYETYLYNGYTALTAFFIISGFVIAYRYYEKFGSGTYSFSKYIRKRFIRLVPVHEFTLLLSIPLNPYAFHVPVLLATVFLLHGFIPQWDYLFSYNHVSWAVSSFLLFYLLFPLMVQIIKKMSMDTPAQIIISLFGLWLLYFVFVDTMNSGGFTPYFVLYILPSSRLFEFISGILIWKLWNTTKHIALPYQTLLSTIIELGAICLLAVVYIFAPNIPVKFKWSMYYLPPLSLIVYVFAYGKGYVTKILSMQWLVTLGNASYEFYLFHWLILQVFLLYIGPKFTLTPIQLILYVFMITIGTSLAVHALSKKIFRV